MVGTQAPGAPQHVSIMRASLPLLLVALLSSSPAWAGAFNVNPGRTTATRSGIAVTAATVPPTPSASAHHRSRGRRPHAPPFAALRSLRGGGEADDDDDVGDGGVGTMAIGGSDSYGAILGDDGEGGSLEMMEGRRRAPEDVDDAVAPPPPSSANTMMMVMAPVSALLKAAGGLYVRQLTLRPVLTKSLTAGVIFGLSDACAQSIEGRRRKEGDTHVTAMSSSRVLTAFLVGLLFFGPAAHLWYEMIFRLLPSTSLLSTLQKALLGQVFFGPAFTAVFFGAGMIRTGEFTLGGWLSKVRADLPGVWASGLGYWPLVDFVSFKVVPVRWIPLFVNFCSFVWTIYLSGVANDSSA